MRNLQVVPLISPDGINYKFDSVSFRPALVRTRSIAARQWRGSVVPSVKKQRPRKGKKESRARIAKGSRSFRGSVRRGQLSW